MSCCYFCGRCHYYCCCKMEKPLRRPLWYPTILCGRKFLRWLSDSSPKDDSSGKRSWSFRRAGSFRRRNLHRSRCSDNIRSKGCNCCYPVCRTRRSAECGSGRRHPSKAGSNPDHPAPIVVPSPVIVPTPVPSPRGTVVGWIIPTVIRISPSPVPVVPAPIGRSPSPTEIEVEVDRAGRSPCAEERRDIFGFDPYFVAMTITL